MDIVDRLIQDHDRLRQEMSQIEGALAGKGAGKAIEKFAAHFAAHESVENGILFPELDPMVDASADARFVVKYRADHRAVAAMLNRLRGELKAGKRRAAMETFARLSEELHLHMKEEEKVLFPTVQKLVCPNTLDELTGKAEEILMKRSKGRRLARVRV